MERRYLEILAVLKLQKILGNIHFSEQITVVGYPWLNASSGTYMLYKRHISKTERKGDRTFLIS